MSSARCKIPDCENRKGDGRFVGDYCSPCASMSPHSRAYEIVAQVQAVLEMREAVDGIRQTSVPGRDVREMQGSVQLKEEGSMSDLRKSEPGDVCQGVEAEGETDATLKKGDRFGAGFRPDGPDDGYNEAIERMNGEL